MASFSCSVTASAWDTARISAAFTGGDSGYTRDRFIRFTLSDGATSSTWDILSNETGGADSTFSDIITGLDGSTTYSWSATVGYFDGSNVKQLSGYSDSGTFTTPAEPVPTGAFIWNGSEWKKATPYIWNGTAWVQAAANVFDGSQWKS